MKKIFTIFHFACFTGLFNLLALNTTNSQYLNNHAAVFNGTNSYVAVPANTELSPTSAITVEAWVYPSALPSSSACIIGKNFVSSYYFGIENSGRFIFFPRNQAGFLRSRASSVVKVNQWNHIAGTYDGTFTRLYINGVLDTSISTITGAIGTNFDSLYIGCDRQSGSRNFFFNGRLDNVRIWKSARTSSEILNNMYIPLSIYQLSGPYSFLSASYQFDNSAEDYGGPVENHGSGRNITYADYSNKAVNHMDYNNSLVLNGVSYCSHYNIGDPIKATTAITLECWLKRDTVSGFTTDQYIINKSKTISQYDYSLQFYNSGALLFSINSGTVLAFTDPVITNAQWNHVAATYSSITGVASIYVNGELKVTKTVPGSPVIINSGSDSLYIGGRAGAVGSANLFRGQMDEVRIWRKPRTAQEIKEFMFKHPEYPSGLEDSLIIFDFDNLHSGFSIGTTNYNYGLKYIISAALSSAHANTARTSSPMISDNDGFNTSEYSPSTKRFFIPDANATGITDSILITGVGAVNDLKVYLTMNHTYNQDLRLYLTSPMGTTIDLLNVNGGNFNDIMTIFSDGADSNASYGFSALPLLGISPPYSPSVKSNHLLSSFNGQDRNGWWKLKFIDQAGGDRGYVHSWGINLKSYKSMNVTALLQGFYDPLTDKMESDTARMYFRIPLPPFPIIDSSRAVLDSNGKATFYFNKVNNGYRVFRHRNSIETWTPGPVPFSGDSSSYDFSTDASKAYGDNLIQVNSSPVRFAVYGGDVDQDGFVNLNDLLATFNNASNFINGYVNTDVNGDELTNLSDVIIVNNNSSLFVQKRAP